MKAKTVYAGALVLFGIGVFPSLGFSVSPEPPSKKANQTSVLAEKPSLLRKGAAKSLGARIAGTYVVSREPSAGISRILTVFADGNLSSIQSIQFGEGDVSSTGFSNQHGVWKRIGPREIRATVLDFSYDFETGSFLGVAVAGYSLQFDKTLQIATGTATGKIFSPGIDPLNPGDAEPISEFNDSFRVQRVSVNTTAD